MFDCELLVSLLSHRDDDSRRMFGQTFRFFPYEIPMAFYDGFYIVEDKILPVENLQVSLLFEQKLRAVLEAPLGPATPLSSLKTIHAVMDLPKEHLPFLERIDFLFKVNLEKCSLLPFPPKRSEGMKQMRDVP